MYTKIKKSAFLAALLFCAAHAQAQTQGDLENFFEGKMIVVKIDMPASSIGVDVFPERKQHLDYSDYAQRLKDHGTGLYPGDRIMITKVKCKDKHIEFQLGGGGYGTFSDDWDYVPSTNVERTTREKNLKEEIKKEKDATKKKALQEEYDKLKKERELEERKLEMGAQRQNAENQAQRRVKAAQSGSRFNIRYDHNLTSEDRTPDAIMTALAEFVEFPDDVFGEFVTEDEPGLSNGSGMPGANTLRKGLLWEQVAQMLGAPSSLSEHMEGTLKVLSCTFVRNDQKITAEFVEGVLIRYTIASS